MRAPGSSPAAVPFAFEHLVRTPHGLLGRYIESWWYARGTIPYARERIAPTGSAVGVIVLGDPIVETPDDGHGPALRADEGFLIGPHDRPVINEPTGETHAVGIVTTSIGCEAVFGVRPAAIRGQVVDLIAAWEPSADLRDRLKEAPDPATALDLVTEVLTRTVRTSPEPSLDRCAQAVAALEADPTRPIASVADELGISHTRLDREFTRVVGLSPRALARLLRMRRLLEAIDVRGAVPWADLAADYGWFDQSHLIRDFRRHTGVSPTDYRRAQLAVFEPRGPGDAAGFVPDPTPRAIS